MVPGIIYPVFIHGEHVGGFTEPIYGSRWVGKINFHLKWTKVKSNNPETAKYSLSPSKNAQNVASWEPQQCTIQNNSSNMHKGVPGRTHSS